MQRKHNKDIVPTARMLRKNMTKEEKHLWYDFLRTYPIRFSRQKVLGKYIADFYCAEAKLIIELDGSGHYTEEGKQRTFETTVSKVPLRYLCHRFVILMNLFYSTIGYNTVNIRLPPKIDFGRFGNIHFQSFLKIRF